MPQAPRIAASSSADVHDSDLRVQLERQRLLEDVSSAARDLATENESLKYEVTGLRAANRNLTKEVTAMKVFA